MITPVANSNFMNQPLHKYSKLLRDKFNLPTIKPVITKPSMKNINVTMRYRKFFSKFF